MRVGAERTSLGSCISMGFVAFEFLSTSQGLGFEFLTPWNHPCLLALTDLRPSRKRGLGLGLGPHCAGRDLAVTGLSSLGPGSQAAAAAQDLWGGKWPLLTVAPPSTCRLDLSPAQGSTGCLDGGGRSGGRRTVTAGVGGQSLQGLVLAQGQIGHLTPDKSLSSGSIQGPHPPTVPDKGVVSDSSSRALTWDLPF